MKIYRFDKKMKKITHYHSNFVMSQIVQTNQASRTGYVQLDESGIIGYHQAAVPQLLLVIIGEG